MPVPSYQDLITLSSGASGLTPESVEERILSVLSMMAGGSAPDGSAVLAGSDPNQSIFTMPNLGVGYANPLSKGGRTGGNVLNTVYLVPFFSGPTTITLNQLDCTVTTIGAAGAVTRMGIYTMINQANPWSFTNGVNYASLLLDAGTVATDGTTGNKVIPISQVIPANTWFGVVGVDQVALATRSLGTNAVASFSPWGTLGGTGTYGSANAVSLSQTGVTGALPAFFVPSGSSTIDGGAGVRRGA